MAGSGSLQAAAHQNAEVLDLMVTSATIGRVRSP